MNGQVVGVVILLVAQQAVPPPDIGATIRGRVFNPDGKPMADVAVQAISLDAEPSTAIGRGGMSNDQGLFEITQLPPGRIWLRATPRAVRVDLKQGVRPPVHPPVFFPGVIERLEAWPIDVAAGETIELDLHVPPVFVASIKAVVSGPDGYRLDQLRVMRPEANMVRNVRVDSGGIGYADNLREGRYAVAARGRAGDGLLAAWLVVDLLYGEMEVALPLAPAASVRGRVIADRGGVPPLENVRAVAALTQYGVELDPLSVDQGDVGADGAFSIDGLFGTRTFRLLGLPADWEVAAVRAGRYDITLSGIDLEPGTATEITILVSKK